MNINEVSIFEFLFVKQVIENEKQKKMKKRKVEKKITCLLDHFGVARIRFRIIGGGG